MNNHVPTLETCKKLKETGFLQDTLHFWVLHSEISSRGFGWQIVQRDIPYPLDQDVLIEDYCAAPILTEILEHLPFFIEIYNDAADWVVGENINGIHRIHKNPAEAAALLFLELQNTGVL